MRNIIEAKIEKLTTQIELNESKIAILREENEIAQGKVDVLEELLEETETKEEPETETIIPFATGGTITNGVL